MAVVGASDAATANGEKAGAVFVYKSDHDLSWSQQAKLEEVAPGSSHQFGYSLAVDEANFRLIVGAPGNSVIKPSAGAANIFYSSDGGGSWDGIDITPTNVKENDRFGEAVDITDDFAIVGAPYDNNGKNNAGVAFIFQLDASNAVVSTTTLLASDRGPRDNFGASVAIDGYVAVVGAPNDDHSDINSAGSIYVFVTSDGGATWPEITRLDNGEPNGFDDFGRTLALCSGVIIVGAPLRDDNGMDSGAAYIFRSSDEGLSWSTALRLDSPVPQLAAQFGNDVDIQGDLAVVGSRYAHAPVAKSGTAYVFRGDASRTSWTFQRKFVSASSSSSDFEGSGVGITDNAAIVGAPGEESELGAAYVYIVEST
eukprot:scaffold2972_cov126-Pinguiococcus_pyrenoidosus.AAC.1